MEQNKFNKHINIRLTENQLKRLIATVAKEKTTLSDLIRKVLKRYMDEKSRQKNGFYKS